MEHRAQQSATATKERPALHKLNCHRMAAPTSSACMVLSDQGGANFRETKAVSALLQNRYNFGGVLQPSLTSVNRGHAW
eukprot:3507263-Amphidinium_carterae.2